MNEQIPAATAVKQERRPKELPFTKKQKRSLQNHKMVVMLEVAVIVVLIALRWFVGGWWIGWDTSARPNTGKPGESKPQETVYGEFQAPEFDAEAVVGVPTVDENLGWALLDVQEGYRVHVCGVLNADADGSLPVWFAADENNKVWVKLRVLDENGKVLGETGILKPGEYVERLQLAEDTSSCKVTLQVMGYMPDTYYSAGTVGLATNLNVIN